MGAQKKQKILFVACLCCSLISSASSFSILPSSSPVPHLNQNACFPKAPTPPAPPVSRRHLGARLCRWSQQRVCMIGAAGPGGGDLAGGSDQERNANLASLKRMFFKSDQEQACTIDDKGQIRNMHLCRWSWVFLPGQQFQLNVWQPQYTLMFEKILAAPPPYYYLHGESRACSQPG